MSTTSAPRSCHKKDWTFDDFNAAGAEEFGWAWLKTNHDLIAAATVAGLVPWEKDTKRTLSAIAYGQLAIARERERLAATPTEKEDQ